MSNTPVRHRLSNDSLRCPHCSQFWNACQCATSKFSNASSSLLSAIRSFSGTPDDIEDSNLQVVDKYEIVEMLGEGGIGAVYLAEHIVLRKKVALKVLRKDLLEDASLIERLKREAQSCAVLNHPNIVSVSDFGITENGFPFIVMEYLEGTNLDQELRASGKFEIDRLLKIAIQLCSGLEAAHDKGVVHRDLKPTNIFLTKLPTGEETIKIVDFGIAKADIEGGEQQRLTQTGELIGSPAYMSPEQITGRAVDGRSDIYSLGCVLYEMQTGKQLFRGASMMTTLQANLEDSPPTFSRSYNDSPETEVLYSIILRCLEKRPDDRYQNAADVGNDLETVFPPEKGQKESGKVSPALLIVGLTVLVLLFFVFRGSPVPSPVASRKTVDQQFSSPDSSNINYLALGQILNYDDYFEDKTRSCFWRAFSKAQDNNQKLLAAIEIIDQLRSQIITKLKSTGNFDPDLMREMSTTLSRVDQLYETAAKDKSINNLYLAQCYFIYSYYLQQQIDYFRKESEKAGVRSDRVHLLKLKMKDKRIEAIAVLRKAISLIDTRKPLDSMDDNELALLYSYNDYLADNYSYSNTSNERVATLMRMIDIGKQMNAGKDSTRTMDDRVRLGDAYLKAGEFENARIAFEKAANFFASNDIRKEGAVRRKIKQAKKQRLD